MVTMKGKANIIAQPDDRPNEQINLLQSTILLNSLAPRDPFY